MRYILSGILTGKRNNGLDWKILLASDVWEEDFEGVITEKD